jgi:uncharacterized protein (TIRG00374 family)
LIEQTVPRHRAIDRRQILWLLVLGIAVFLFVPKLIGFRHTLALLQVANPIYLVLALVAETLRYLISAASTIVLARVFAIDIPLGSMVEAFFGGAAANRTFSTGGAPGMLIRLDYLAHRGVTVGAVAVIFLIEDLIGLVVGGVILVIGIVTLTNALPPDTLIGDFAIVSTLGTPALVVIGWYLYRRRAWVERGVHAAARVLQRPVEWLLGRPALDPPRVQRALNDFYTGMSAARRAPLNVVAALAFNVIRYVAGAAALFFAFYSLNWTISPGALILIYTTVSLLSSVSAVPGEVAIMGGSFALLSLAFGVPGDIALLALLLSRAIAFWLPIPVGYAALWHLRHTHLM